MININRIKSQYSKCALCRRVNKTKLLLCKNCQRNPFNIDKLRNYLSQRKDYTNFKSTYSKFYPQIINRNTNQFWNIKFIKSEQLQNQDKMTKDKIDFIVKSLPKHKSRILDLGIGQGYMEQKLKNLNIKHKISGVDISQKSIERANLNFEGSFYHDDILNINRRFHNNYFDVVVAIEVFEHIQPKMVINLYKKIHSLLKDNGRLIISIPLNEGLSSKSKNPSAHVRAYTIPIINSEFKISNFTIVSTKIFYAFRHYYTFKKLITLFIPLWKPNNVVVVARKT